MHTAVVHEVTYEPGAFKWSMGGGTVPDRLVHTALQRFRLSDDVDFAGHFINKEIVHIVSARVPYGTNEGVQIQLWVIIPEPHDPDENLETSLARFEEFIEVYLSCYVDQSLRSIRDEAEEE